MAVENKMTVGKRLNKKIYRFFEGAMLEELLVGKRLYYAIVIVLAGILMISISYYSMWLQRDIEYLRNDVKELHMENVAISSELIQNTRITNVESRVMKAQLPLVGSTSAPIFMDK